MKYLALFLALAVSSFGSEQAQAQTPFVVTDIPPIHSLVSQVMGDTGLPYLLLNAGASPHDYSLRPSDASKLAEANLIVYTSSTLTPWLSRVLSSLAAETQAIELISTRNTVTLPLRENHLFTSDSHAHSHNNQATETNVDPHAWLDPQNARQWIDTIATHLATLDPDNAARYQENAKAAMARIGSLTTHIERQLSALKQQPFIVFHDSYHYFESRFDFHAKAAISLGDASQPTISRMNQLRTELKTYSGACVFSEPQFNTRIINTVVDGMDVKLSVLDPLGAQLEPGPMLYETLLGEMANAFVECAER